MAQTVLRTRLIPIRTTIRPLVAEENPLLLRVAAYGLALLLVVHATFRGFYADLDSVIYSAWYQELSEINASNFFQGLLAAGWIFAPREDSIARFEWGFSLLGWLMGAVGVPLKIFYAVIASLSLFPKTYLAVKYTRHPLLAIFWYVSFCYLLLEMNAMRAGVAAAFMMLALVPLYQKRYLRYAGLVLLAATFHVSALFALLIPLYTRWHVSVLGLSIALLLAFGLSFVDLTMALGGGGVVFAKISEYKVALDSGFGDVAYLQLNSLNSSSLGFLVFGLMLMGVLSGRYRHDPMVSSALSIYFLPILVLFSIASFPIIAARLSELLCIYQMFSVVKLIDFLAYKVSGCFALVFVAVLQFSILNFHTFNVDFFYFLGNPKFEIVSLVEQKIAADSVLNSLFLSF